MVVPAVEVVEAGLHKLVQEPAAPVERKPPPIDWERQRRESWESLVAVAAVEQARVEALGSGFGHYGGGGSCSADGSYTW